MKTLYALVALAFALPVNANTFFNYDGFYARMKKSEKAEFSDITLAFVLQRTGSTEPCAIEQAKITTDISEAPLTLAHNGELILPFDQKLNDNKAIIRLYQAEGATPCDLNFKLRSKMPLEQDTQVATLVRMQGQFDELLDSLAGLGKYWLPDVTGLTLHFSTEVMLKNSEASVQSQVSCQGKSCQIRNLSQLTPQSVLQFSAAPLYATPLLATR